MSDLPEWLLHSKAPTYADDISTGTPGKNLEETLKKVEEDAQRVLQFMASNGLVANAKKTLFLLINCKMEEKEITIKIGSEVVSRDNSPVAGNPISR